MYLMPLTNTLSTNTKQAPRSQTTGLYFMSPRLRPKFLPSAPRHLGREVPKILLPTLVVFSGPLSRQKLLSVFLGVQWYPFQRPGTSPTISYRMPITR